MPTLLRLSDPAGQEDRDILHELCLGLYLHDECYAFAIALHQGLEWPIVGLMDGKIVIHAGVRSPEGRLHDVRGRLGEEEFGSPFLSPPFTLCDVDPSQLYAIRPIDDLSIARARRSAEVIWPDLPWIDSFASRAKVFTDELELLCRKHGLWMWNQPGSPTRLSQGDGSEGGYALRPSAEGSAMLIERYFSQLR